MRTIRISTIMNKILSTVMPVLLTVAVAFPGEARDDDGDRWLDSPLPQSWNGTAADSTATAAVDTGIEWWRLFDDPLLDTLITRGREANYDVAVAGRRIEIARAQVGQARAAYYPALNLSAGYARQRQSGRMLGPDGSASTTSYFSGEVSMNWEIDVFGKITRQVRQKSAEVRVSAAEFESVLIAVDASIAKTYIGLLASRAQMEVANRHTERQANILESAEARYAAGLASKLDVAQARTLYYSTIASIPLLQASIDASLNALAVLIGTDISGLPEGLMTPRPLPEFRQPVDMGVPADLLRRRPDIDEAERSIEAAAAALGIARSEYLPSLSVSASAGTAAHRFKDLFTKESFTYSVMPTLSWTIFEGFGRRYANEEARQSLKMAVDQYNLTVLTAMEEVRSAASNYSSYINYIVQLDNVVANAAESSVLSFDLYRQGLTDFTDVDNAEMNYLTYENTLVTARSNALSALIDLYKALGGSWTNNSDI